MRVLPGACQESSTSQSRRCESRVGVALARAPQPCRTTATLEAQVPVNSRSVVDPSMPTQAAQEGPHHRVSSQQAIRPDVGSTSSIEMTVCGCRRGRIRANPDLRRFATRATANSTSLSLLRVPGARQCVSPPRLRLSQSAATQSCLSASFGLHLNTHQDWGLSHGPQRGPETGRGQKHRLWVDCPIG